MQADPSVLEQNKSVLVCFTDLKIQLKRKSLQNQSTLPIFHFVVTLLWTEERGRHYWGPYAGLTSLKLFFLDWFC